MFEIKFSGPDHHDVMIQIQHYAVTQLRMKLEAEQPGRGVTALVKDNVAPLKPKPVRRDKTNYEEVVEALKQVEERADLGIKYVQIILGRIPVDHIRQLQPSEFDRCLRLCKFYMEQK